MEMKNQNKKNYSERNQGSLSNDLSSRHNKALNLALLHRETTINDFEAQILDKYELMPYIIAFLPRS